MKEFSEERLIQMLSNGDEKAMELIFHNYYRPLTLFATKYVKDVDEAREITQDFFVRLWTRQPSLSPGTLKTYLYRGVRNACLNYIETNKVAAKKLQDYNEPEYTHDNVLRKIMLAEQEAELMLAIDNLPHRCREIFLMSRVKELSYKSIADELNISTKTVEAQISIALRRLRELLISFSGLLIFFFKFF
ncbi:RNA polymerase sigma-70 factor [Fulvivirga maritima]|uniref:RNA polymerase sigma-70 factor n=1 Tax=Fulvivirga maritima TaxID=2904247 RepID=UPI001F2D8C59|nr:RNA polymerase sigma-70 factor [Fulvivirga maritima]UII27183.1 RNA polymerase sigma-70 factor [Fulvivirga maritima]